MAITWKQSHLPTLAERKIAMATETCQTTIYNGIDVELSGGTQHFSLQTHDQTNIDSMFTAITLGATEYPYHADGDQCVIYSAADIVTLYIAYKSFVTYQTTYCNYLKIWMARETDKQTLGNIAYGSALPDDLQAAMDAIIATATAQIGAIAAGLTNADGV